jgi:putative membrane protein
MDGSSALSLVTDSLRAGLPVLLPQFLATLLLLAVGVMCYRVLTPFRERELVAAGNTAGGVVYAGSIVAMAIPLAATLATSTVLLDIVMWGIVALILQLIAFGIAAVLLRDLRRMIEDGNVAAALALVGIQFAIALLNAGAMAG